MSVCVMVLLFAVGSVCFFPGFCLFCCLDLTGWFYEGRGFRLQHYDRINQDAFNMKNSISRVVDGCKLKGRSKGDSM
ncbi:hypothetical protein P8452_60643 [Trifolium repens]|nr:hypothetical protein P8452_60643 [Trifolium repens]